MKMHTKRLALTRSSAPKSGVDQMHQMGESLSRTSERLESRSERIRAQFGGNESRRIARLRPPKSSGRIYSDAELKTATEMFLKLQNGEDRRPRPFSEPGHSVDPLDRVVEVLLELVV